MPEQVSTGRVFKLCAFSIINAADESYTIGMKKSLNCQHQCAAAQLRIRKNYRIRQRFSLLCDKLGVVSSVYGDNLLFLANYALIASLQIKVFLHFLLDFFQRQQRDRAIKNLNRGRSLETASPLYTQLREVFHPPGWGKYP